MLSVGTYLAYSQTITPDINIKEQLITNIASRVAQLKLVEKRGIIGTVNNATNTQITITDLQDNTRFVDVDEFTKFTSPKSKGVFGISDIKGGETLGVLGLYNKDSRRILARFVTVLAIPKVVRGGVASIDNNNFTIDVSTIDGKKVIIDVGYTTSTYSYSREDDYIRSGFSKIQEDYSIIASGTLDPKDENKILATRILIFPDIPFIPKTK